MVALMILGAMMLFQGCDKQGGTKENLTFTTEYQAVLLNNGQYFFGKMEKAGSAYPVLRNVYYVRQQMNPETKQVKSSLVKRSMEPLAPDMMYINASSIAFIEPVSPDSKLETMIKQAESQNDERGTAGGRSKEEIALYHQFRYDSGRIGNGPAWFFTGSGKAKKGCRVPLLPMESY
ncbi:MAG: hypothetical protein MZV70_48370 [Desulfobacterales bacterium]|nr:hypothetical protein [Desulfobacterales bacterium]